jgi:hypothetical protein
MIRAAAIAMMGVCAAAAPPAAATAAAETVLGYELERARYTYVVTSAVNVREKPATTARRLDTLPEGAVPDVLGRHKGWYAIARDGEPFGFVYGSVMLPTLPGALDAPLQGRLTPSETTACDYVIRYVDSQPIVGEFFGTSDYSVRLTCATTAGLLRAVLPMFLIEGPLGGRANPVFQINVDVPQISGGYDQVLSAIALYRAEDDVVRFDALSVDGHGAAPDPRERPASTVAEALATALELAAESWNDGVWNELIAASE